MSYCHPRAINAATTPSSTQRQPRRWLAALALAAAGLLPALPALAAVPAAELQTLTDLYNSTNGAGWTTHTNWLSGDPCDNHWYGITCDAAGAHVTEVSLVINQLTGTLPSLSGLTNLQRFYVSNNQLTGAIPSLSGLTNLQYFYVSNNQLTGAIPSLSGLTNLQDFYVENNQLTGAIPSLSGLTNLQVFYGNNNQLTGAIPSLSGLTNLQRFYVNNNQLTGTPPAAPATLLADNSALCPNYLSTPSPTDAAWDTATGSTPWSAGCTAAPSATGVAAVPTLGEWALLGLGLLLAGLGAARVRGRP